MIINEYIKSTKHILCPLYVKMFNRILDTGVMPSEWSAGTTVPLYKNKGDIQDVSNYWGITLLVAWESCSPIYLMKDLMSIQTSYLL